MPLLLTNVLTKLDLSFLLLGLLLLYSLLESAVLIISGSLLEAPIYTQFIPICSLFFIVYYQNYVLEFTELVLSTYTVIWLVCVNPFCELMLLNCQSANQSQFQQALLQNAALY